MAFRMVQNQNEAEDIVQETFIKLWTKRDELEAVSNLEGFAIIILKNTCLDYLRKSKQEYQTDYDVNIPEPQSLSKQIEIRDQINQISLLMKLLPEQQRRVMQLKHWEGYSDEEIEEITGLNKPYIKVILSRTRKLIREQFIKLEQS
jgi:RNA polymerase sigma-70 factor (ECF subfamily)